MKVLILDDVSPQGLNIFDREGMAVDVMDTPPEEELLRIIGDYSALMVNGDTPITGRLLDAAGKLQIIGRAGAGVDNIDLDGATKRGILVANAPGGNAIAKAEHTLAMMLALARNIPLANNRLKKGVWDEKVFMGSELCNKTLGIIGLGRIGSAVAQRARALQMNVTAWDPYISESRAAALGVEIVTLEALLKKSDLITIHAPRTDQTVHMLSTGAFAAMKDGVLIINCAHGGLIDEDALLAALKSGKVAGAALDVFESEPVTQSPLFELDNVIVTPHLGPSTKEARLNVVAEIAYDMVNALKGRLVRNTVNIPHVDAEQLARLKPYINLGEKLGLFLSQVTGRVEKLEIDYSGKDFPIIKPITAAIVKGFLDPLLQDRVNFVNALMLAGERGIRVKETVASSKYGYANAITLRAVTDGGEKTVDGTIFNNEPRIAMIDGYRVNAIPAGLMMAIKNTDKPGMIGILGTILGRHNVSIAGMQNGRKAVGETAITIVSVETEVPPAVLREIAEVKDILEVKMIRF